jgi:ABC-type transport system substrate-binding protein
MDVLAAVVPRLLQCRGRVAAALMAIGLLAGCGPQESRYFGTTSPRHGPDEIWINTAGEPEWLDPNKCADGNCGEIIWNTFAGLVQAHPTTLEPLPEIATRWDVSPDGRTYTFHLRP